jgi:hypothetical protein
MQPRRRKEREGRREEESKRILFAFVFASFAPSRLHLILL